MVWVLKVVARGIIPHVNYGSALYAPPRQKIAKCLAQWSIRWASSDRWGWPNIAAVGKAGLDAEFVLIKEAIQRWSREVWLLNSGRRAANAVSAV